MSDVFISYARSTEREAMAIAEGLRGMGFGVWRDDEIPAHRSFADVIEERLTASKAVVVLWSADAVKSTWVQSEADRGRTDNKLVQLSLDGARLPMPFDRIQCVNLTDWSGDTGHPGWRKIADSVADLCGKVAENKATTASATPQGRSICVLPFVNMSGDPEQEYFSDGISEDIITDLSQASALNVASRNSAFTFKGKSVEVPEIGRKLGVSHVLEGSVRKAGNRVRITAQLIEAASDSHLWAQRWDRDLDDIFALQDEISQAVVAALKIKLLPAEKKAIAKRGTESPEAYDLYLMARSYYLTGNTGDPRRDEAIERLARGAAELDPGYAQAWALLATAQYNHHRFHGRDGDGGEAALERALALNPDLAEAHSLKAVKLSQAGRHEEASAEIVVALRLNPESWEVNFRAANINFTLGHMEDAARHFEKAATLETDFTTPSMLVSCYTALGDGENARRAACIALERAEKVVAQDRSNGHAMGVGARALAALGETDRAKEWMGRALLIDPDNLNMRYIFACILAAQLGDPEAALDMLAPVLEQDAGVHLMRGAQADPDLASVRDDPRFKAMIAAAEARLAAPKAADGAKS